MGLKEETELRECMKREVANLFSGWDADEISSITERISDDVIDDVVETSDYPNYNDSDVRIAIKRIVLFNLG